MKARYSRTNSTRRLLSGFTLIELLVVVAIISLLLAIIMPVHRRVRTTAKRVMCQTNLRDIAVAWDLYLIHYDERFYQLKNANHDFGGWKGVGGYGLPRPLNPYVGLPLEIETENEATIFRCPADSGGILGCPPQHLAYDWYGNSYETNLMLVGPTQLPVPSDGSADFRKEINKRLINLTRAKVSDHSRLVFVGDNNWFTQFEPSFPDSTDWHGRDGYFNLAFLDGHVDFIRIYKGYFVRPKYRVLPFAELDALAPEPPG